MKRPVILLLSLLVVSLFTACKTCECPAYSLKMNEKRSIIDREATTTNPPNDKTPAEIMTKQDC